jgi:drug/metabolite transporter (DMT)-like permease
MGSFFGFGFLLMLIATCGYATVALFGKWIFLHQLPMYMILMWRFGGAAVLFAILSKIQKSGEQSFRKEKGICFLLGLCVDVPQTTLFFFTVLEVGASVAALLLYAFPLFVFILQRCCFKQQASILQWLSLGIALVGIFLVVPCNAVSFNLKGTLFGLGTAITYACYLCFGARYTKTMPVSVASAYLTFGAFCGFAILALFFGEAALLPAASPEWLTILGMIAIATVAPLLCLVRGMQLLGAAQSALLFTMEPVITIISATLLFEEPFTLRILGGSMLILLSALLFQRKKKPARSCQIIK